MITYCTNIHPGETWDEILLNLNTHLLTVKKAVSSHSPFPIGLRLSNQASLEIDHKSSERFHKWCRTNNCFIATINGFPFGAFHCAQIKEKVYLPDWRSEERVAYTKRLSDLLDTWLPEHVRGSISTVPIGFKSHITRQDLSPIKQNLISLLEHLDKLKQRSGKEIILCLEPEPGCIVETTKDVVEFYKQMNFPDELRHYIGICFDCCHQAVQFENPSESLKLLSEAHIEIGKIQVSSGLRIRNFEPEAVKKFCEPCYLHQVVIKHSDGSLSRYNDLEEALYIHHKSVDEEWRIHFHVPVFMDKIDTYETTRYFTEDILSRVDRNILLEVETYTWNVLPQQLQLKTVTDSIIREIQWVQSLL